MSVRFWSKAVILFEGNLGDPEQFRVPGFPFSRNDIDPAAFFRASLSARHNRSGVTGMSKSVMPSDRTAFRIAFMVAASAPEVPDSPTPLEPSAFALVGTGWSSQRIARIKSACGIG